MAKAHSKLKTHTTKAQPQERFYTVGYTPNGMQPNPRPQLTIAGRWLEELGFYSGRAVIVTTEKGKLTIELDLQV